MAKGIAEINPWDPGELGSAISSRRKTVPVTQQDLCPREPGLEDKVPIGRLHSCK